MKVDELGSLLVGWQIFFICFGAGTIALRLAAKRVSRRAFHWHDVMCFAAYVFLVAFAGIFIAAAYYGLGYDDEDIPPENITIILKMFFASEFMYNSGTICMRLSILFLYMTLFRQRWFKWMSYGVGAFVFLFPFGSMVYLFAFCRPLSKNWYPEEQGTCGNTLAVEIVSGAVNLVLDVVLIMMPMPILWGLQMPVKKKIGVSIVFCLGIVTVGINVGRIIEPLVSDFSDFTIATPASAILSSSEICTDILVACVPLYGPLIKHEWLPGRSVSQTMRKFKRSFRSQKELRSTSSSEGLESHMTTPPSRPSMSEI